MKLFHLSDDPGIAVFRPRPSDYTPGPVVWAIDETRIANYLLPRDCPRVCFRAGPDSRSDDIESLLGGDRAVIAIEAGWLMRVEQGSLWRYAMPEAGFRLQDEGAGYWVSEEAVVPVGVEKLADLPAAIAGEGVTLRVMESLWDLHDTVRASSLVFSLIRMRNAAGHLLPLREKVPEGRMRGLLLDVWHGMAQNPSPARGEGKVAKPAPAPHP